MKGKNKMKIVAVGDAFLPENYFKESISMLMDGFNVELKTIKWGSDDEVELDKRARNLEVNGPEAESFPKELLEVIPEAEILLIHYCPISREILQHAKKLKILGICRAGYENVDVEAATKKGILVFNVMGRTTTAVSEYTIGLLLAESRNIARGHEAIKKGIWRKEFIINKTPELENKTIGIIGFGEIGKAVAEKVEGFKLKKLGYDPFVTQDVMNSYNTEKVELNDLLKRSDFITLHVRLNENTRKMIGRKEFELMKKNAYLINSARAGLVDNEELYKVLKQKKLAGAALDVFDEEPLPKGNKLLKLDNLTLTPHLASSTIDCVKKSPMMLLKDIKTFIKGEIPKTIVNKKVLKQFSLNL